MANLYNTAAAAPSPSSPPPPERDDFSVFLHQVLLRSSVMSPPMQPRSVHQTPFSSGSSRPTGSSPGFYFPVNVSSSSVGTIDNDVDELDYEKEELGIEEATAKAALSRNPAKRTRAAEVHNLSEKRRRSRINEKMKALQNLIPNSNKTDKASMLDEAIEYLKQLQLQVQMLTMRNGLSLYHMCLPEVSHPGQLPQMNTGFLQGNGLLNMDLTGLASRNAPDNSTDLDLLPGTNISSIIHSGTSDQATILPDQLHISSVVDALSRQPLDADQGETNLPGKLSKATTSEAD